MVLGDSRCSYGREEGKISSLEASALLVRFLYKLREELLNKLLIGYKKANEHGEHAKSKVDSICLVL